MELVDILNGRVAARIAKGQELAGMAFDTIENDMNLLRDFIVPFGMMAFIVAAEQLKGYVVNSGYEEMRINDHAIGQLAERNNVPQAYLRTLATGAEWQRQLAAQILNTHTGHSTRDKVLLRVVGDQLRGVLSDKYRRLDSRQILANFIQAAAAQNAVLVDAHSSETRFFVEVVRPGLIEIETPNNGTVYLVLGAQLRNSDFGAGSLQVKTFGMQAVCLNGMVIDTSIKEVHLGRKLPEDLRLSQRTYDLDTQAQASLVTDVMNGFFKPEYVQDFKSKVQRASATEVDAEREIKALPVLGLTKGESERVGAVLLNNRPDDGVQGGMSLWKLAQAVGAVARDAEPERAREIQEISGKILTR